VGAVQNGAGGNGGAATVDGDSNAIANGGAGGVLGGLGGTATANGGGQANDGTNA